MFIKGNSKAPARRHIILFSEELYNILLQQDWTFNYSVLSNMYSSKW